MKWLSDLEYEYEYKYKIERSLLKINKDDNYIEVKNFITEILKTKVNYSNSKILNFMNKLVDDNK